MDINYEKYDIYKAMKINLKKSMSAGFYYEAIFIEYAIIEDRCCSLLRHAGVKYLDSKEHEIKLSDKLKKLGSITKLMGFRIPHIINSAHINEF